MRGLCAVALTLVGCVGDVVIARVPSTDVGTTPMLDAARVDGDDSPDVKTDPALRIEVTATGEDNANNRSAFGVAVEIYATRHGTPTDAALTLSRSGVAVPLLLTGPGHFGASLDDYPTALVLTFVGLNGSRHEVALSSAPIFTFLSPRLHERVEPSSPVVVSWSPYGGAEATLLAPDGRRAVDDNGTLTLPPGVFVGAGVHVIRLRRSTTVTPAELAAGSTFTAMVVNSVEVEVN